MCNYVHILVYSVDAFDSLTEYLYIQVMEDGFPLPCPLQLSAASQVSFEELNSDMEFLKSQQKGLNLTML